LTKISFTYIIIAVLKDKVGKNMFKNIIKKIRLSYLHDGFCVFSMKILTIPYIGFIFHLYQIDYFKYDHWILSFIFTICYGLSFSIMTLILFLIESFFIDKQKHIEKITIDDFEKIKKSNDFVGKFFFYKNKEFLIENYDYFISKNATKNNYLNSLSKKLNYNDLLILKEKNIEQENLINILLKSKEIMEILKNNDFVEILKQEKNKDLLYKNIKNKIRYIIKEEKQEFYQNILSIFEDFENNEIILIKHKNSKIIEKSEIKKVNIIQI